MNDRRIWWSYLGRDYRRCREAGLLQSPERTGECSVRQVRPGDLIVHENARSVVAISRVETEPECAGEVWRVEVTYLDAAQPVKFLDGLDARLREVEPPDGPMHAAVGSGQAGGSLYPFNEAALRLVLAETETTVPAGW